MVFPWRDPTRRYEDRTQVLPVLYTPLYARAAQPPQPSEFSLSYQGVPYSFWKAPAPHSCFLISDESIIDENQQQLFCA
ncbi:MAG TPA: hypothetical protein V6D14_12990 [Coleofasciculaceae cyanobacterium]